jgi:hypothetical protein
VWAAGRVTDKKTGKPVKASIDFYAAAANPALKDFADYAGRRQAMLDLYYTKADGSFRVPVLPGAGLVAARATTGVYLPQQAMTNEQARARYAMQPGFNLTNFHAVAAIDAEAGSAVKCDLAFDPGLTLACKVVGPDGQPVKGAHVRGLVPNPYWETRPLSGADFTVRALHPQTPRWLVVLHPGLRLGASVTVKAGDEPFTVRLEPTGTITGRVLDYDGRPWKQQDLRIYFDRRGTYLQDHLPDVVRSDDDGRFRVEGVISGLRYQVNVAGKPPNITVASVAVGLVLKPGEVRDLGDVKARKHGE